MFTRVMKMLGFVPASDVEKEREMKELYLSELVNANEIFGNLGSNFEGKGNLEIGNFTAAAEKPVMTVVTKENSKAMIEKKMMAKVKREQMKKQMEDEIAEETINFIYTQLTNDYGYKIIEIVQLNDGTYQFKGRLRNKNFPVTGEITKIDFNKMDIDYRVIDRQYYSRQSVWN